MACPIRIKLSLALSPRKVVIPTKEESEKTFYCLGYEPTAANLGVRSGEVVVSDSSCLPMTSVGDGPLPLMGFWRGMRRTTPSGLRPPPPHRGGGSAPPGTLVRRHRHSCSRA